MLNQKNVEFFSKPSKWQQEYLLLRDIISTFVQLEEDYKWKHPCYTLNGKNVVLIHGFKEYCALLFHKGALIENPKRILIQQTENVQSARQIRFQNLQEIIDLQDDIRDIIAKAIEIEKSGKTVVLKKVADYAIPDELQDAFSNDSDFNNAFYALTEGRQRGYLFYFNQAKQPKTRISRIEKYYQHILDGKGLYD